MTLASPSRPDSRAAPAEGPVLGFVPFPRYSVALVQDESEMLQAPSCDLHMFLEHDPVFEVELFTERSFHALSDESSARFDCIVLGYNATYRSRLIRQLLANQMPKTGLCVLHQLDPTGFAFLKPNLEFEKFSLPEECIRMARGREPKDEILLNWPAAVHLDDQALVGVSAHGGLVPGADTEWRTVLETVHGGQSYPVLLRSPTAADPQVVVCSALLSSARPSHAALLKNMITWCAAGRPDVVVMQTPGEDRSDIVHRKLRLQGAKAIVHEAGDEGALDFDEWPLRGVANVVLPARWQTLAAGGPEPSRGLRRWLDHDGRIIRVDDNGDLLIRHGASDARWVARQWVGWFAGQRGESWHGVSGQRGSIVRTRAVLRALVGLRSGIGEETADGLGLPRPTEFAVPCEALLRTRLRRSDTNIDATVSATTAALEIDRAIGGRLGMVQARGIKKWLRQQASEVDEQGRALLAAEDRLEIARCLGDRELTLQVARDLVAERDDPAKPIAASLVTKLREAVVTSGLAPGDLPQELTTAPRSVELDVRDSPLLAANYLYAWCDLRRHWEDPGDPLAHEGATAIDRTIIAVGKHGVLVKGQAKALEHPHELVSAEALALLAYFQEHEAATHMLPGAGVTPPDLLLSLVREARDLRRRNAMIPGLERTIFWAKWIVGIVAVLVVAGLSILVERSGIALPVFADLTTPIAVAGLLLGATWALNSIGLQAEWLGGLAQWVRNRAGLNSTEPAPPANPEVTPAAHPPAAGTRRV